MDLGVDPSELGSIALELIIILNNSNDGAVQKENNRLFSPNNIWLCAIFGVTRFFWGEKRIDLAFLHLRCRMLIERHNNFRGRY
jgi:hypothetical protein